MSERLLDTGVLVALLDAGDPAHEEATRAFARSPGRLITTGAVLTEAFYMLRYAETGPERLVDFLEKSDTTVINVFSVDDLRRIAKLMKKYADRPMDFADASLVLVAEEKGCEAILTLDERGFRAYRFRGTRRFRLVIQDD